MENSAADHHLEEMIAILTFGGSCELVQRFTNDYMPVKDALGKWFPFISLLINKNIFMK